MASQLVTVSIDTRHPRYVAQTSVGEHRLSADEPASLGGGDTAPTPTELLLSALGSCTAITLRMYAERKQWPVETIEVTLNYAEGVKDKTVIERRVHVTGALDDEQRARLLQIANACPVHKILTGTVEVPTEIVG